MDGAACVQLCSDPPIFKYKLTALTFRICLVIPADGRWDIIQHLKFKIIRNTEVAVMYISNKVKMTQESQLTGI